MRSRVSQAFLTTATALTVSGALIVSGAPFVSGAALSSPAPAAGPASRVPYSWQNVRVVAGGLQGIFRSADGGAHWARINTGARQWGWTGQAITGDPRVFGPVYLATNGRGVQYGDPLASR